MLLRVRINGGPVLRLLLDTGATDITIDKRSAERSGFTANEPLPMVCPGQPANDLIKAGVARSIEIGPVTFHNYRADVTAKRLPDGLQGVVPLSLFRGFLVRLDFPNKTLELEPYREAPSREGFSEIAPGQDLLFVQAAFNRRTEGYVLLDSGSSYTAVSNSAALALKSAFLGEVSIRAGSGEITGESIMPGVRFQFGGREVTAESVVAIDLTTLSRFSGVQVAGVIGFPELRTRVLTVNYRDALVRIGDR
jgi:hypothetical protein